MRINFINPENILLIFIILGIFLTLFQGNLYAEKYLVFQDNSAFEIKDYKPIDSEKVQVKTKNGVLVTLSLDQIKYQGTGFRGKVILDDGTFTEGDVISYSDSLVKLKDSLSNTDITLNKENIASFHSKSNGYVILTNGKKIKGRILKRIKPWQVISTPLGIYQILIPRIKTIFLNGKKLDAPFDDIAQNDGELEDSEMVLENNGNQFKKSIPQAERKLYPSGSRVLFKLSDGKTILGSIISCTRQVCSLNTNRGVIYVSRDEVVEEKSVDDLPTENYSPNPDSGTYEGTLTPPSWEESERRRDIDRRFPRAGLYFNVGLSPKFPVYTDLGGILLNFVVGGRIDSTLKTGPFHWSFDINFMWNRLRTPASSLPLASNNVGYSISAYASYYVNSVFLFSMKATQMRRGSSGTNVNIQARGLDQFGLDLGVWSTGLGFHLALEAAPDNNVMTFQYQFIGVDFFVNYGTGTNNLVNEMGETVYPPLYSRLEMMFNLGSIIVSWG